VLRAGSSARARRAAAALTTLGCALAIAACSDSSDSGTPARVGGQVPGEGGTLRWSVADPVREVDPLTATSQAEQLAARQINEPLIERLRPPFGDTRHSPGLARSATSSRGDTEWSLEIRSGIRFQDGARLNAGAVLVNAERWRTTTEGRALLGNVVAVDAPRPNLVRFFLANPDPKFDERLAEPQLGLVSPRALSPRTGTGAVVSRTSATGTGAFELRERDSGSALLARNTAWWGTAAGLGPALDQIELDYVALATERLRVLDDGEAEAASSLGSSEAESIRGNPLLTLLPSGDGLSLGLERSVRGIDSGRVAPSLSGAWLTRVGSSN
jgi:MarR-like DNA-binding transcriptional regulator SgrR of sgrS sRNA